MKKIGVVFLALFLLMPLALAQTNTTSTSNKIDNAYLCLENQIENKNQEDLSFEEAIFSTLALGSQSKLEERIDDEKNGNCWPASSCKTKETSQAIIAYDSINKNTDDAKNWLLSRNSTATDLTWFLQIDIPSRESSSCTLKYQGFDRTVTIGEDMTIAGSPGSCFTISESGFWLRVSNACFDENFQISCDKDFVTALLYQKTASSTVYISPDTHSAVSLGTTDEKVNAQCFKESGSCDYEGTLWATIALDKLGTDVSDFLPYLVALSEENQRVFPEPFLFILTKGNEHYSKIIQSQKQSRYWEATSSANNRFYDTALALLALQGEASPEADNAKNYLLEIQTAEGCWNNNNIRDTAFLLYGGWGESTFTGTPTGGTSSGQSCLSAGFFCESSLACDSSGGTTLSNYECSSFGEVCCSESSNALTCAERNGEICSSSEQCSGATATTLEGSCCLGTCEQKPQENTCERFGGSCGFSCDPETQEQTSDSCEDPSLVCCVAISSQGGGSNILFWIIGLVVLIVLIALGIIYRNKLRLFFAKLRKKKTTASRKPPYPPARPPQRMIPPGRRVRPPIRRPVRQPQRNAHSAADKELEETLKKLKEMSK